MAQRMFGRVNNLGRAFNLVIVIGSVVIGCSASDEDSLLRASHSAGNDPVEAPPAGSDSPDADAAVSEALPTQEDAGADAAVLPSGGNCKAGYIYCGGNKVIGDKNTLYECNGPGVPTVVETCTYGCIVNPSVVNDACAPQKVASPVPGRGVTYAFGEKNPRYRLGYHTGDDYATPTGTPTVAVRAGKIRWSNDNGGDFGRWMALDADNGRTYVYAHLDRRLYQAGATVVAGQVIALTGNTGLSTGPHLHFEDRPLGSLDNGKARKPTW